MLTRYSQIVKISILQEVAYKTSFVMWRVRNVLQIIFVFYLWSAVFQSDDSRAFGYNQSQMLTYVFGIMIVRAFVLSAKSVEVGGEISRGDLSNYLVKPISYFKYWATRDVASKVLNLSFAVLEFAVLFVLLRPPFFIQTNPMYLLAFGVSLGIAAIIYFILLFITGTVPFWAPEAAWGSNFLVNIVFVEFMSGVLFPLDVFPVAFQKILYLLPFPYMIFFPIKIYLGQVGVLEIMTRIIISAVWTLVLYLLFKFLWKKGLTKYEAYGR